MGILVEPHRVNRSQSRRRYTVSSVSQPPLPRFLFLKPYSRNQQRQTSADRKKTPAAQTFLSSEATRQAISAAPIERSSNPAPLQSSWAPSISEHWSLIQERPMLSQKFQVIQLEIHRGFRQFLKHFLSIEVDLIVTLILQLNVWFVTVYTSL